MNPFPVGKPVELRGKIKSVEALAFDHDKGKAGVGGAATGAIVGALIAGPLGLMAGSLLGAKAGKRDASDSFQVHVTLVNKISFIATVSLSELEELRKFVSKGD